MRFSDRVTFVTMEQDYYDPETGEYVTSDPKKVTKPCKLSALGFDRRKELYGELDVNVTVCRLQRPYEQTFDFVEVKGKKYDVTKQSNYRKGVLMLEGDNHS